MKKDRIGRNILLLMEYHRIPNESQLAKTVKMPQTTINKLISGVTADPRISTLEPIAKHFNISLDMLLSDNPKFGEEGDISADATTLVPLISFNELNDIYNSLSSLNKAIWPNWYPVASKGEYYYCMQISREEFPKPFDEKCILIIKKTNAIVKNNYYLVKHEESNSISIKRIAFDSGSYWLLALQPELPAQEFNDKKMHLLGVISAKITNISNSDYISFEE